ncbi:hypothetical protein AU489_12995 [Lonsdalea populi]|nr:hypothetical protein AU499_15145 [Lonsdalea populi]RAT22385.1 hypothetical protein AU489_12995 [Lonsdalea populi]RAT41676.1 hypothetical protein AU494_12285 [Lonsdalea populi]RAT42268.1 hypothetical protein AU495_12440 [Lonsdalea populi]
MFASQKIGDLVSSAIFRRFAISWLHHRRLSAGARGGGRGASFSTDAVRGQGAQSGGRDKLYGIFAAGSRQDRVAENRPQDGGDDALDYYWIP